MGSSVLQLHTWTFLEPKCTLAANNNLASSAVKLKDSGKDMIPVPFVEYDEGIFFFKRGGKNWYENFSQSAWGSLEYGGARVFATFKTVLFSADGFRYYARAMCRIPDGLTGHVV